MKQFRRCLGIVFLILLLSTLLSACGEKNTHRIILAADLPGDMPINPGDMSVDRTIIQKRCAAMGIKNAQVVYTGERQITLDIHIPEGADSEALVATIARTGLLEFVDMGSQHPAEGTLILTDYPSGATEASAAANIYHTVMTGSSIAAADVEAVQQPGSAGYAVAFTLNSDGAAALAEFTGSHIGQTLAIVMDKKVITAPTINSKIEGGSGYIQGSFTRAGAQTLAILMRHGTLPLPLKVMELKAISPAQ